jgi:hypothetical protein
MTKLYTHLNNYSLATLVIMLLFMLFLPIFPLKQQTLSNCIAPFWGAEIPKGWLLCDGTNNTPDLRNRFIFGGSKESQEVLLEYRTEPDGNKRDLMNLISQIESKNLVQNSILTYSASLAYKKSEVAAKNYEFINKIMGDEKYHDIHTHVPGVSTQIDESTDDNNLPYKYVVSSDNMHLSGHDMLPNYYTLLYIMKK